MFLCFIDFPSHKLKKSKYADHARFNQLLPTAHKAKDIRKKAATDCDGPKRQHSCLKLAATPASGQHCEASIPFFAQCAEEPVRAVAKLLSKHPVHRLGQK